MDHPIVRQTIEDCLTEAMDVEGFLEVLRGLARRLDRAARGGHVRAVGLRPGHPELASRTRSSTTRRSRSGARRRCCRAGFSTRAPPTRSASWTPRPSRASASEAWPQPETVEEVHEALLWMGYVTVEEAETWQRMALRARGRGTRRLRGDRWFAVGGDAGPEGGPARTARGARARSRATIRCSRELEAPRARAAHAHRRPAGLVRPPAARAHSSLHARTPAPRDRARDGRRSSCAFSRAGSTPIPSTDSKARAAWRRARDSSRASRRRRRPGRRASCPRAFAVTSGSGSTSWSARARWSGDVCGARAPPRSGGRRSPSRRARTSRPGWRWRPRRRRGIRPRESPLEVLEVLSRRGAMFLQELARETRQPAAFVEEGLKDLIARGRVTCDSYGGLRWFLIPSWRRKAGSLASGRWSLLERRAAEVSPDFVARRMLARTGVVFRKTLARERIPVPWRDVARVLRAIEARGEVRGGRFVAGVRRRAVRTAGGRDPAAGRAPALGFGRRSASGQRLGRGPAQLPGNPDAR